jgi:hypothetical protein
VTGLIRRGSHYRLDVGLLKDDNKITTALTYEGIAGRQENGPDRIAKHVGRSGKRPLG